MQVRAQQLKGMGVFMGIAKKKRKENVRVGIRKLERGLLSSSILCSLMISLVLLFNFDVLLFPGLLEMVPASSYR